MQLTVLFVDICGSTALSAALELERYDRLLDFFFESCKTAAQAHGGKLTRGEGDGAIIAFGLPNAIEDQGRRAVEAALDIGRSLAEASALDIATEFPKWPLPIVLRSGIHGGVLLVASGRENRDSTDLIGEVANVAKKLADAAGRGGILASQSALGPYAYFFDYLEFRNEGTSLPKAFNIVGRVHAKRRFDAYARRGLSPLTGRETVLSYLHDFARRQLSPSLRCVVVVGDAGYGKTRLIEELCSSLDEPDLLLLRGSCESYLSAEVLQPFLHIRAAIPPALVDEKPAGRIEDFAALLRGVSEREAVVLVIDDWQWADDASRQLLEVILQMPAGPIVLLAARRREGNVDWVSGAPHIELSRLSPSQSTSVVRAWLPDADPFLADEIREYAGDVPLFIEEFCVSARGGMNWRPSDSGGSIQAWLASLVAARTAKLPPEDQELLRAAAVIGATAPLWLVERLCERTSLASAQRLANADLMHLDVREGSLRFKHGFTRDALYERIHIDTRNLLHREIVSCLEHRESELDDATSLQALAYHTQKAGLWALAAQYAEKAGDSAIAANALDRSRVQYLAALQSLDQLERTDANVRQWCLVSNKLGMACIFDPLSLVDGLHYFDRAAVEAAQTGDTLLLARARYWLGYMCYGFGRFRAGVAQLRAALALSESTGDGRLSAQVAAALGQSLAACCEYDEALPLLDKAVSVKRQTSRPGSGLAIGSAYALACKAVVQADRGDFVAAHTSCDEALVLLGGSTHPVVNSVRNWLCVIDIWQGLWQEAEANVTQGIRIAENTRGLLMLAACRSMAGYIKWASTSDPAGLVQMREAVSWMESRKGAFHTSLHYGWLVEACVEEGNVEEARRHMAHVLLRARHGDRLGEAAGCRAMAVACMVARDDPGARHWLVRAEKSARLRRSAREAALNMATRSRVDFAAGRTEGVAQGFESAVDQLAVLGMTWHSQRIAANAAIGQ